MAQIKLLKIASDGVPLEFNSTTDDITLNSYTVQGGGPVLSGTGLDMNGQDITDLSDLVFTDPAVGTVNQTAGALIINNIMAKERNNIMTTAGAVLFPLITDVAGQVDSFKLPNIAGVPSATPAFSSDAGYLAYDSSNKDLYVWDGVAWDNLNSVETANNVQNSYIAEVAVAARDVVFISSADNVSPALADNTSSSYAIGLAVAAAAPAAGVEIQSEGVMPGFTGLTAGARYYLSAAVAGAITATIPVGTGNTVAQIGYAKSTTALHLHIEQMGRRA